MGNHANICFRVQPGFPLKYNRSTIYYYWRVGEGLLHDFLIKNNNVDINSEQDIHISSKHYAENAYGCELDLLIILH